MPEALPELLETLALLAAGGLIAGLLAGLLGIGGGIVMVPILFLILDLRGADFAWRMHIAVATALAVIVPTSLSSLRAHARRGALDRALAGAWAPMVALGAAAGSLTAAAIGASALIAIFAVFAGLMGVKMLLPLDHLRLGGTLPLRGAGRIPPVLIGCLAALMGIGGATFSVPYMTVFGMPIHRAVGTAALIGAIVSAVGVIGYIVGGWNRPFELGGMLGFVHWPSVLVVAPVSVFAAPFGARMAHALPRRALTLIFGVFLLATSARLLAGIV